MKRLKSIWNSQKFLIVAIVITAVISPIAAYLCADDGFKARWEAIYSTCLLPLCFLFRSLILRTNQPILVSAFRYVYEENPIGVLLYGATALIAVSAVSIGLFSTDPEIHLIARVILLTAHFLVSLNMCMRIFIFERRNHKLKQQTNN